MTGPDDARTVAATARADQEVAAMTDLLLERAAKYDNMDLHEAGFTMMDWLDSMPVTRVQLCAAVAVLALRVHRQAATDG